MFCSTAFIAEKYSRKSSINIAFVAILVIICHADSSLFFPFSAKYDTTSIGIIYLTLPVCFVVSSEPVQIFTSKWLSRLATHIVHFIRATKKSETLSPDGELRQFGRRNSTRNPFASGLTLAMSWVGPRRFGA